MNSLELKKIALRYHEKGYNTEDLRYGDDLYDATEAEKEECYGYYYEIDRIGQEAFSKSITQ